MNADNKFRLQLIAAFAATYIIWGSTYLFIRFAIETLPPFIMAGFRFIVAGLILYFIARAKSRERLTLAHWRSAAIIGFLLLGLGNGLVTWSELYVSSGLTALVIATVPLWAVLLEWLFSGKAPSAKAVFGIVLGLFAIGVLVEPGQMVSQGGSGIDLFHTGALIFASIAWATGSLYSRTAPLPKSGFLSAGLQMFVGGCFLVLAGLVSGEASMDFGAASTFSILSLIYLTIFGSLFGLSAYMWLIKNTTPAKATTYAFVNPAIAVFLGWAFAGEALGAKTLLALALVVAAVVLVLLSRVEETGPRHAGTSGKGKGAAAKVQNPACKVGGIAMEAE